MPTAAEDAIQPAADAAAGGGPMPRVLHLPLNVAGIPWANVQALRAAGVDAKLLVVRPQRLRPGEHDIDLGRRPGHGLLRREATQLVWFARVAPRFDVFHFYFGETLIPKRVQFPLLRALRKRSLFHFLGSDIRGKTSAQLAYARMADARVVGSYDAIRWVPDATVVPPGIDLSRWTPAPAPPPDGRRVRVVHAPAAPHRRAAKGTDAVIAACAELPVDLDIVSGVPNAEAAERFRAADIVVDQLGSGWYGKFAIETMALGKPVVARLNADAAARTERAFGMPVPIVDATKETLADRLRPLVASAELRRETGRASRRYVEHVHANERVADRLIAVYRSLGC